MVSRNPDGHNYKDLSGSNQNGNNNMRQLDVFGTPMPVKSPVNFEHRLQM